MLVTGISNGRLSGLLVSISLYGFAIAFVITTAISLRCVDSSLILLLPLLLCHFLFFVLLFIRLCKTRFLHWYSTKEAWVYPKNLTLWLPILNLNCYFYLWLQNNPKFILLPQQRAWSSMWICRCILYAAFWGYPNCSLTDTQLP